MLWRRKITLARTVAVQHTIEDHKLFKKIWIHTLKTTNYPRKFGFTHWRLQIIQQNSNSRTEDQEVFKKIWIRILKTTGYSRKFGFKHWKPQIIQQNSDSSTEDHKLFNKIQIHTMRTSYSRKFRFTHRRPQLSYSSNLAPCISAHHSQYRRQSSRTGTSRMVIRRTWVNDVMGHCCL